MRTAGSGGQRTEDKGQRTGDRGQRREHKSQIEWAQAGLCDSLDYPTSQLAAEQNNTTCKTSENESERVRQQLRYGRLGGAV
eukprot:COSAG06_NODE_18533_length_882_cov_56.643678_1_plen_81_part_10